MDTHWSAVSKEAERKMAVGLIYLGSVERVGKGPFASR
jgi:hypothetical protein